MPLIFTSETGFIRQRLSIDVPRAFCNTFNIDSLDRSRNNLTRLPELCALVETIRYFNAKCNKISSIRSSYFKYFVGLHEINLSMNRLGMQIEPDFSPLTPTLRLIRLSGNPWGRVLVSLYNATYRSLSGIYLDNALIVDIPADALRSWPHIVGLGVRNDIRNTTRLTKIRIRASNNPWHCGSCLVSVKVCKSYQRVLSHCDLNIVNNEIYQYSVRRW